jgi:hypothetical protein
MTSEQRAVANARANLAECRERWEQARTPQLQSKWDRGVALSKKKIGGGGLSPVEEQECWAIWDSEDVAIFGRLQGTLATAFQTLDAAEKALKASAGAGATGVTPARLAACQPPLSRSLIVLAQACPQRAWSPRPREQPRKQSRPPRPREQPHKQSPANSRATRCALRHPPSPCRQLLALRPPPPSCRQLIPLWPPPPPCR